MPTVANMEVPMSPSDPPGATRGASSFLRFVSYNPDMASTTGAYAGQWWYGEESSLPKPETDT